MKKTLAVLVFACASALAFALPSPKDIQTAVESGNYVQAESQLREVLREKPASARAHYELGQVLARVGRKIEARAELLEAQRLDPSLKFAANPQHFRDMLAKLSGEAAPAARTGSAAQISELPSGPVIAPRAAPVAQRESSFPWGMVAAGGGVLLVLWFIMRAMAQRRTAAPMSGQNFGGGNFGATGYGNSAGPAPAAGSGMGGAVLGGLAGLAAGYGLAKVLEHGNDAHAAGTSSSGSGYAPPLDAPTTDDYGAFDAGSGDSWDAGGGDAGGGDDNW